jgi:hypothetical protein
MVKQKNNQSASKEDKRKVILVKLMAPVSHRSDPRYNSNVCSSFKGKENYQLFLLNGNTGQDGLS